MVDIINNLYSNFFELRKEEIDKYVEMVKSNIDYSDISFIQAYIGKFIPILTFTYDYNINEDVVIRTILTGQINDYKLLGYAISEMDKTMLLSFYDDQLVDFTNMLDSLNITDKERLDLFNIVLDELIESHADKVLEFVLLNKNSKYLSCISAEDKDVIIESVNNTIPELLSDNVVNYVLENDEWTDYFVLNLYESFKTVDYSDYTRELIIKKFHQLGLEPLEDMPIGKCGHLLNQTLNNNHLISTWELQSILRSIARNELGDDNLQVYFVDLGNSGGYEYSDYGAIAININILDQFMNYRISGDIITLLELVFHECAHIKQEQRVNAGEESDAALSLIKEILLQEYNKNYYDNNYETMYCEQEAHLLEKIRTREFVLTYIEHGSELLAKYDYDSSIEEEKEFDKGKKRVLGHNLDLDRVFEHLVYLKPSLVTYNPLLQREFNLDGTKKDGGKSIVKK